ncbi:MAG: glycosyltransferase, partial [Phycisphaerae bacterium]
ICKAAITAYLVVLSLLCVYGLHRYFLVLTYYRNRRNTPQLAGRFSDLPLITVQLPMFNERFVARRVIEHACRIEYPRDRLEIQVLDDSTDETRGIVADAVAEMAAAGHPVVLLHRENRRGYKAGALAEGLKVARGAFVAIFDADFLPPANILLDTIHFFTSPDVGMVQCRWDHLNRDASMLTQAQAVLLDGHFVIEHAARNRSGRYMSFNGTAGVWRREAIEDAGGWHLDTLTEDLDLSYRAQLRGWRFVFLPELTSPAELPPEMNAFKAQQHRWTKGGVQTCVKLLPAVLRRAANWRIKVEAFFHLTSNLVYVLMVLLTLLIGPALFAKVIIGEPMRWWQIGLEYLLFFVGTGSALAFYIISQRETAHGWFDSVRHIPALMALGIGIAFNNAVAAIEGLFGRTGEFVRTPKFGDDAGASGAALRQRMSGLKLRGSWQAYAELAIAFYLTACLIALCCFDHWIERVSAALPFLAVFISGYLYVATQTLYSQWLAKRRAAAARA